MNSDLGTYINRKYKATTRVVKDKLMQKDQKNLSKNTSLSSIVRKPPLQKINEYVRPTKKLKESEKKDLFFYLSRPRE